MMWMKKPGLKLPNFTKTKTTWKVSVAVAIPTVHVSSQQYVTDHASMGRIRFIYRIHVTY